VRTMQPGEELALYRAKNEAFRDHWGHLEAPEQDGFALWQQRRLNDSNYDRSLWFLATDGDEIAGFSLCQQRTSEDPAMGWVNSLGVRRPWRRGGSKIVIADTLPDYWNVRGLPVNWSKRTANLLRTKTDRPIVIRDKESKLSLYDELKDAHCLVAHGSIAAVEAVVMGTPVFVDKESAAALVGRIGFDDLENPVYPERQQWLNSLAYHQWNETELIDGTLWKMIE